MLDSINTKLIRDSSSALGSYGSSARQDSIALPFELAAVTASSSPSSSSTISASTTASVTCTPRTVTLTQAGAPAPAPGAQTQTVSGVECVLYLTVKSIVVPQRLKGTLTYLRAPVPATLSAADAQAASADNSAAASSEAASCEKLDFSLPVPCYSYLLAQQSCSPSKFSDLISGGMLTSNSSSKVNLSTMPAFPFPSVFSPTNSGAPTACTFLQLVQHISILTRLTVVEVSGGSSGAPSRGSSSKGTGARSVEACSLYGQTIQQHAVCVLLKAVPSASGSALELHVEAKSSDEALVCALVDELKQLVLALPPLPSA